MADTYTYGEILNGEVAVGAPVDTALMTALRDNALALKENASTIPAALRPVQLLGASGSLSGSGLSTVTFSGLDLTQFEFLIFFGSLLIASNPVGWSFRETGSGVGGTNLGTLQSGSTNRDANLLVNITHSDTSRVLVDTITSRSFTDNGVTQLTTSIDFFVGGQTFTSGEIKIYGVR